MRRIATIGAGLAFAAFPALAYAQETTVVVRERPMQVIEIGAGATDFTQGLNDETDPGFAWDVRAIFGTASPIGVELAYVGSLNDLNTTTNEDANLMLNGGEAMLRLNLTNGDIQPFVAAGAGLHNYTVVDVDSADADVNTSEFDDSTDIAIPVAAGIQAYLNDRVTLGARVTYRYIFDDQVVADEDATDAQSWAATARLGVAF